MTHFGWNFVLVGVFAGSPSQNNVSKKLTGNRERNLLNSLEKEHFLKIKILHFSSKFKCKSIFLKLIGLIAAFRIRGYFR